MVAVAFSEKKCRIWVFLKNTAHFLFTHAGARNLACREGLLQACGCERPGMKPSRKRGDRVWMWGRRGTATLVPFQACFCHFPRPLSLPDFMVCHTSDVFIFCGPKESFFASFSSMNSTVRFGPNCLLAPHSFL